MQDVVTVLAHCPTPEGPRRHVFTSSDHTICAVDRSHGTVQPAREPADLVAAAMGIVEYAHMVFQALAASLKSTVPAFQHSIADRSLLLAVLVRNSSSSLLLIDSYYVLPIRQLI